MSATSTFDAGCRALSPAPRINHWTYESIPGQIRGCDGEGRVLVAIAADEQFAARLAAAFHAVATPPAGGLAPLARPAFPF